MNLDYLQLARDRLANAVTSKQLNRSEAEAIAVLQHKLDRCTIEIAAFGMVSRGKTAVLNALIGKKLWETGATHGVTQTVETKTWVADQTDGISAKIQIELIDTPGIDEVAGEERAILAIAAAQKADLILFVIAGDMNRVEQTAIAQLRECYKPMLLVFNKIDLYPESDRLEIHAALQSESVRQLISPDEIVFSAAEPMPTKVRLQYADRPSQDIWECQAPNVESLKIRILSLLNQEGKALLALNAMRSLAEIETAVTLRHLQNLPPINSAAFLFIGQAIALLICPWFWLDGLMGGAIASGVLIVSSWGQTLRHTWVWWIALNATILAITGIDFNFGITPEFSPDLSHFAQIGWAGITLPWMWRSLRQDIEQSSGWGKLGAKTLIQQILQTTPTDTILSRIKAE
jgi:uncharacterized protein